MSLPFAENSKLGRGHEKYPVELESTSKRITTRPEPTHFEELSRSPRLEAIVM